MWPCITCLPIEPPSGAVCGGWWHRARRCRHIEQMETVTAMERFRAIAGERGMVARRAAGARARRLRARRTGGRRRGDVAPDLQAIAVVLDLVDPIWPGSTESESARATRMLGTISAPCRSATARSGRSSEGMQDRQNNGSYHIILGTHPLTPI
jgi:hypothetical protein